MSRYTPLTDELYGYLVAHTSMSDPLVAELVAQTWAELPEQASMQIGADQAAFLQLLTSVSGVRRAVEVGTFTGLSALSIARGMGAEGRLLCCDVSPEYTSIARRYWQRAGVADRIELVLGPALETLRTLPPEPHLDLVFIDADKPGYPAYWAELVPRMRPGGILLADNVLWSGRVLDPEPDTPETRAIVRFNDEVRADDRVESVILPIGDGLTLARRR